MLVSAVQQSESAVCKHTFPPSGSEMLFKRRCWDKTWFWIVRFGIWLYSTYKVSLLCTSWVLTADTGLWDQRQRNELLTAAKQQAPQHIWPTSAWSSGLVGRIQQTQMDTTHPGICHTIVEHWDWGIHCFHSKQQASLLFVHGNVISSLRMSSYTDNPEK